LTFVLNHWSIDEAKVYVFLKSIKPFFFVVVCKIDFLTVKALNQARLEASVRPYGETSLKSQWPSPFAIVSGVLLVLSFFKYFYSPLEWLAIVAVVAGVFPILAKAVASVTRFRLDINALTLIAGKTQILFPEHQLMFCLMR